MSVDIPIGPSSPIILEPQGDGWNRVCLGTLGLLATDDSLARLRRVLTPEVAIVGVGNAEPQEVAVVDLPLVILTAGPEVVTVYGLTTEEDPDV